MPIVETIFDRDLKLPDARGIVRLGWRTWPPNGPTDLEASAERVVARGRAQAETGPRASRTLVVRAADGSILAQGHLFAREIGTSAGPLTVLALGGVCVDPDRRGGLGSDVVRSAFALVDDGAFDASLFQTSRRARPFYERLGACVVTNRIVDSRAADPHASPLWDELAMRYPADRAWPAGEIDLRGPAY